MKEYRVIQPIQGEYSIERREPRLYEGMYWKKLDSFTEEEVNILAGFIDKENCKAEKMQELKASIGAKFVTIAFLQTDAANNKRIREGLKEEVAALQSELTKLEEIT